MPRHIERDRKHFRDIIGGKLRKQLRKFFTSGKFVTQRGKNGKLVISLPKINQPFLTHGDNDEGVKRGPGEKGKVIGKDKQEPGNEAGNEDGEGMLVSVDLEYALMFMKDELKLPNLKPKENDMLDNVKYKYNDISLVGPESLRHNRRTWLQAMKRMAATGEINKLHTIPGSTVQQRIITPIASDKRFRQYKEVYTPSSNAVLMFGRDGSGSMDEYKCGIISDMCWWLDVWVRNFYAKVERCYFWHDTTAQEVDEEKFYKYRYGGGTHCSSCPKLMSQQFENRFPPSKWNIYVFYFTDGDNWDDDNNLYAETVRQNFPDSVCNLFAITQVCCYNYNKSLKKYMDESLSDMKNYRSVSIGGESTQDYSSGWGKSNTMNDEERNEQIKNAIKHIMGAKTFQFQEGSV